MRNASSPDGRSISPWWALLILPIGLAAGWLIGGMPTPSSKAPAAQPAAAAPTGAESQDAVSPAPAGSGAQSFPPPPPPAADSETPAVVSEWTSPQAAFAEAQRTGKPVMFDFNAEWCGPCRMMAREVFEDAARSQSVKIAVIPVSIVDRTREDGRNSPEVEALQQRFEIRAFPTLVIYSPQTNRGARVEGYMGADQTVQWIEQSARSVR